MSTYPFGREVPASVTTADLAAMIDHSLLRPELTRSEVLAGCELAVRCRAWSVCVKPADVASATRALVGTRVAVCTVVGFPHGSSTADVKCYETERALADGAVEIDMVLDIGSLRGGAADEVRREIERVAQLTHGTGGILKVILETAYLTDAEVALGSRLVERAGGDFVKTSTGFAPGGATFHHVAIMAEETSPKIRLKAAGGVRTLDRMLAFVSYGVTRFGATATESILADAAGREESLGHIAVPAIPPPDDAPAR
jgi:deoxyribose-phosphate aldolase